MAAESGKGQQAHRRASVKWLLTKAFNNDVPSTLKEPFYRDQDNQDRLKPQIIVNLSNATLYCQTLSNLYSDPNYESFNHWFILQLLTRKGALVAESSGEHLTETVLRQTNPIKISAHMSVIKSLMVLYAKEITSSQRMSEVIRRFSGTNTHQPNSTDLLKEWVTNTCREKQKDISNELEADDNKVKHGEQAEITRHRSFDDFHDGIGLALLISFYCPSLMPWNLIKIRSKLTVEECIYNITLVSNFCTQHLACDVFHMSPEDVVKYKEFLTTNIFVLLSDLFHLFEIQSCKPKSNVTNKTGFVVHKTRAVSTLSSMRFPPDSRPNSASLQYTQPDEQDDIDQAPAGKPSKREQFRLISYGGRRSHRNSTSDDSQLTIENFGGSQEQLNVDIYSDRNLTSERRPQVEKPVLAVPVRSSITDAMGTFQLGYDNNVLSEEHDKRKVEKIESHKMFDDTSSVHSMHIPMQETADNSQKYNVYMQSGDMLSDRGIQKISNRMEAIQRQDEMDDVYHGDNLNRRRDTDTWCSDGCDHQIYSSQQHLGDQRRYAHFGSTPSLSKPFATPMNVSHGRPASRESHVGAQMHMQPFQNEYGEYIDPDVQYIKYINRPQMNSKRSHPAQYMDRIVKEEQGYYLGDGMPQQINYYNIGEMTPNMSMRQQQMQPMSTQYENHLMNDHKAWQTHSGHQRLPDEQAMWSKQARPEKQNNKLSYHSSFKNDYYPVYSPPKLQQPDIACFESPYQFQNNHSPRTFGMNNEQLHRDDMAPQSICFIGDEDDVDIIERGIIESMQGVHIKNHDDSSDYSNEMPPQKYNVAIGNSTYRKFSPLRPSLHSNSFQDPQEDQFAETGFYISFDNGQPPKHAKPPMLLSDQRNKMNENITENNDNEGKSNRITTNGQSITSLHAKTKSMMELPNVPNNLRNNKSPYSIDNHDVNILAANTNQASVPNKQTGDVTPKHIAITDESNFDPKSIDAMERRKEKIMLLSLQRRQQQEEMKARKEIQVNARRAKDREKEENKTKKKEEQASRRAAILEQHRLKKAIEEAEREGTVVDRTEMNMKVPNNSHPTRFKSLKGSRPRPKTIHVDDCSIDISGSSGTSSRNKQGSTLNLAVSSNARSGLSSRTLTKHSPFRTSDRKTNSLVNLCEIDSGLERTTPPRRAASPSMILHKHMTSPSGPGSLPPGLMVKKAASDDGSNDNGTILHSVLEYSGPKLYKQPATKSNRGIILNAVEYCVFPGVVNQVSKQKVLEKIARSEAKHFLILFRDAGCQFRALYSYSPDANHVAKLYGTGPSQVDEIMFDMFFKYNSGGKCFSRVHTKHLTVTIDAFTIHNSLWQGKKVHLHNKRESALVI